MTQQPQQPTKPKLCKVCKDPERIDAAGHSSISSIGVCLDCLMNVGKY
jgi:hypothetical protein